MSSGTGHTKIYKDVEWAPDGTILAIGGNERLAEIYKDEIPDGCQEIQIDVTVNWSSYPASGNSWSGWNPPESDEERLIDEVYALIPCSKRKVCLSDVEEANKVFEEWVYAEDLPSEAYEEDGPDEDYYRD